MPHPGTFAMVFLIALVIVISPVWVPMLCEFLMGCLACIVLAVVGLFLLLDRIVRGVGKGIAALFWFPFDWRD